MILGCMMTACLVFKENVKLFARMALLFCISTSNEWDPFFLYSSYQYLEFALCWFFLVLYFYTLHLNLWFTLSWFLYEVWIFGLFFCLWTSNCSRVIAEKTTFSPLNCFCSWLYLSNNILDLSVLLHWPLSLSLCQYYSLITIVICLKICWLLFPVWIGHIFLILCMPSNLGFYPGYCDCDAMYTVGSFIILWRVLMFFFFIFNQST